ncbi:MAG: virulence factor [Actinomycetota bacterium]
MSRRRGNDAKLVVIYWRDIPAQVTAGGRADGAKVLLEARFQHAIDRAAAVAGKTATEDYVAEWRRVTEPLTGDPEEQARARAAQLEAQYPRPDLERLVRSGGLEQEDSQ